MACQTGRSKASHGTPIFIRSPQQPNARPPTPTPARCRVSLRSSPPTALTPRATPRALRVRVIERGGDDTHLDAALNPAPAPLGEASALNNNTLLQVRGGEEAEEADAAAAAAAATPARPLTVPQDPANVVVARRVVSQWRAYVAGRKACPLLDLLQRHPDLFLVEVLQRLDPTARTMLAQVGRPWLAAVLASGLLRLPKGVRVLLQLREFCTCAERLAWAKANGCPWGRRQGLTSLHFSAQRKRFEWDRACIQELFRGCLRGA